MDTLEKTISNFVETQFPEVFREDGPVFVLFVKKYYEWMESQDQTLYHTRRLFEYKDVDETTDQFLLKFKEQYLKNIQIDTAVDTPTLLKHSLDLYRSKGSERGIKLLFQAAFGVNPRIYYPTDDLFRTSDGHWHRPEYIECTIKEDSARFVGKEIIGIHSKAKAIVEAVIRKRINTKLIDVFYLSNIRNDFISGEKIKLVSETDFIPSNLPTIIGSLNSIELDVEGVGENFSIGDVLDVYSDSGIGAKARVTNTSFLSGVVSANLIDGGYGFTNTSVVLASEKTLRVSGNLAIQLLETVSQNIAHIAYISATGSFVNNESVFTYHANNDLKGSGKAIVVTETTATNGTIIVETITGNLNATKIYNTANAVSANQNSFTAMIATGNVVGFEANSTVTKIGVWNINNQFYANSLLKSNVSNVNNTVLRLSTGSGFNMEVDPVLRNTENVSWNSDFLRDYQSVLLSAVNYGFRGTSPNTDINTIINDALNYDVVTFGSLGNNFIFTSGKNYDEPPFILAFENKSYIFSREDYILKVANLSSSFAVNEIVTQGFTNGRGKVLSSNSSTLVLRNLRVLPNNDFMITSNSTTMLSGESSGASANCIDVAFDSTSNYEGFNALFTAKLKTANGTISQIEIVNSGFGFSNDEFINIGSDANQGRAVVSKQGIGSGYYLEKGGFLSDIKKLYDGYYWQDFSYDIISSVEFNKYSNLLKQIVHTAGFKFFGTFRHQATACFYPAEGSTNITIT